MMEDKSIVPLGDSIARLLQNKMFRDGPRAVLASFWTAVAVESVIEE
jgi:hypothetical protein